MTKVFSHYPDCIVDTESERSTSWPQYTRVYCKDTHLNYILVDSVFILTGPGSGGSTSWGSIGGTLANQADLDTALSGKLDSSDSRIHAAHSDDQDISGKLDKNTPITPGTNTKVTYDANGLVTVGAAATTADIADSANKRYVTDTQLANSHPSGSDNQDLSGLVPKTTTVNNHALSGNIAVTLGDVGGAAATHASGHVTGGGDIIANAIPAGNAGLMTGADKTKLDGIASGAVSDHVNIANKGTSTHAQIDTHLGASAPHAGHESTVNKGAVSGYAPLDAAQKVPTASLGGAGADNTKYLRGDQTWAGVTASPPDIATSKLVSVTDQTIPAGTCAVIVGDFEISSGCVLDILSGAVMAII